jgi:hypothetical protein
VIYSKRKSRLMSKITMNLKHCCSFDNFVSFASKDKDLRRDFLVKILLRDVCVKSKVKDWRFDKEMMNYDLIRASQEISENVEQLPVIKKKIVEIIDQYRNRETSRDDSKLLIVLNGTGTLLFGFEGNYMYEGEWKHHSFEREFTNSMWKLLYSMSSSDFEHHNTFRSLLLDGCKNVVDLHIQLRSASKSVLVLYGPSGCGHLSAFNVQDSEVVLSTKINRQRLEAQFTVDMSLYNTFIADIALSSGISHVRSNKVIVTVEPSKSSLSDDFALGLIVGNSESCSFALECFEDVKAKISVLSEMEIDSEFSKKFKVNQFPCKLCLHMSNDLIVVSGNFKKDVRFLDYDLAIFRRPETYIASEEFVLKKSIENSMQDREELIMLEKFCVKCCQICLLACQTSCKLCEECLKNLEKAQNSAAERKN